MPAARAVPAEEMPDGALWPVVEDPSLWRRFVLQIIETHHRIQVPGAGADQCSCGRPFMLCPVGSLAHHLRG